MSNESKWLIGGLAGIVLVCLCVGAACVLAGGLAFFQARTVIGDPTPRVEITRVITVEANRIPATRTPQASNPGQGDTNPTPLAPENAGGATGESQETLDILENETVPINDPRDLALRLEGKENIPETVEGPAGDLAVGTQQTFWASDVDTNENFQVEATLRYATPHLYFWIENGVDYDEDDLRNLAETFESDIYPTNRDFFGSEWSPGVDNDPHLYVLYARGLGESIAGYFSSADELHPDAHEYSNAHEMFMLSADNVQLGEDYIYGTMSHEFQHMIHWYRDRNEESWLNEGFSVLSELLNNYDVGGFDWLYVQDPDLQLTTWPSPPNSTPHYGASFLFLAYFLDRFGDEATQAVVEHPDNGMDSIDAVLAELNQMDPTSGAALKADDVFADWVVASFLNDESVEDGRYAYQRYEQAPSPSETEEISSCDSDWQERSVKQYGVDYIRITCRGDFTMRFEGSPEVGVIPVETTAGDYAFWSNKGDESDMTLTREFDFTQVSGPITLRFNTWYDLEEDYDYLYLVVSEDGQDWEIIKTPSGTDEDPSGNSYGWGYNGQTGDWMEESVDLSQYAGKKIQLRFEYVTDAAVNGEGFLLDDVSIPEINYTEDFESGEGDWIGEGFVRIQNRLPQLFRVSLIRNGRTISVETVALEAGQPMSIPLQLGGDVEDAVLVVSGVTRFTTQEAQYRFRFER